MATRDGIRSNVQRLDEIKYGLYYYYRVGHHLSEKTFGKLAASERRLLGPIKNICKSLQMAAHLCNYMMTEHYKYFSMQYKYETLSLY